MEEDSIIKPIGWIAQAIEAMTMPEYLRFMVRLSKLAELSEKIHNTKLKIWEGNQVTNE